MTLELAPFLFMNGRGNEAIEFYKEALNAEVIFKQIKDCSNNDKISSYITYSIVKIGETNINISDVFPGMDYSRGKSSFYMYKFR